MYLTHDQLFSLAISALGLFFAGFAVGGWWQGAKDGKW